MTALVVQEGFIRDDFAGPGGWDAGLRLLGLDSVGVEFEADAVATARAAGFKRWHADVTSADVRTYAWGALWGYIASPPCQTFSLAGGGAGRKHMDSLLQAIKWVAEGATPIEALRFVADDALDERSVLVLEPLLVIREQRPRWVALEQVPPVLPIWEAYADVLRSWGYSVATGNIMAEQYGVPQTRKRAVLMASLDREVTLPRPTHSKYYSRAPKRLDVGVAKWVSMAEALGWGMTRRPYPTLAIGGAAGGTDPQALGGSGARRLVLTERTEGRWIEQPGDHPLATLPSGLQGHQKPSGEKYQVRDLDAPAMTVTGGLRSGSWVMGDVRSSRGTVRNLDEPAPTVTASMDNGNFQFVELVSPQSVAGGERAVRGMDQPSITVTGNFDRARFRELGTVEALREEVGRVQLRNNTSENAGVRDEGEPAPTMYFGARLNKMTWEPVDRAAVVSEVERRLNNQSGTEFDLGWPADRPAPVIAGRDLVTMPGANANRFNGSTKSRNDGVRVTVQEAGVLQSFPADYPWTGTKTSQFQQCGNAIPPLLAAAIIYQLTGPLEVG